MSLSHYKQPLICTYSGGKDSDVMLNLFRRAGIPFEVINSHTTADAPQTVRHIREVFHQLELDGISCKIVHPTYGSIVSGEVQSWSDYDDGDQIQVKINGTTYLVHSVNIVLIHK